MVQDLSSGECFASFEEWQGHLATYGEKYNCRWRFEQGVQQLDPSEKWTGWCDLCGCGTTFLMSEAVNGSANFREELVCACCGMNARVRAALRLAAASCDLKKASLYITEQASPTFVWLQKHSRSVVGSEYFQSDDARNRLQQYLLDLGGVGSIRFGDVTKLDLDDSSENVVLSFDVLEHVPDYQQALREFARVLKPGGTLILTAPFVCQAERTTVRARVAGDGSVEHLLPPEYHGDPLADKGILCFYHFGWDILADARAAGFATANMSLQWSPGKGLMGQLWTLVATR